LVPIGSKTKTCSLGLLSQANDRFLGRCPGTFPAWRYPAVTLTDMCGSRSVDDWLACEECHELIEAGDRNALARRSLTTDSCQMALGVIGQSAVFAYRRDLHDRFWKARRGSD
jgi:hypothetical protein